MIIAIDGPAGAGKGTLARRLAAHLGYAYLDTGTLYRAAALRLLRAGADPDDPAAAEAAARALAPADLEDPALREDRVGALASQIAALPGVRAALLGFQRRFAAAPPGGKGAVLDGRDIGTVVWPEADVKLYVDAAPEERARRRWRELVARGAGVSLEEVRREMAARDARDGGRAAAPMRPAPDAHLLDSTNLSIEDTFDAALAIIHRAARKRQGHSQS